MILKQKKYGINNPYFIFKLKKSMFKEKYEI